jgi:hypothetical protein
MAALGLTEAVLWTERLLGFALLLQSIELLQVRHAFGDAGVFRWAILREDQRQLPAPLRWFFATLLPYPAFLTLLGARLVLAPLLALGVGGAALPLLLSQLAINARFRGTFSRLPVFALLQRGARRLSERPTDAPYSRPAGSGGGRVRKGGRFLVELHGNEVTFPNVPASIPRDVARAC